MLKIPIRFRQTEDMLNFLKLIEHAPFQMDLVSGYHSVDAKSLMGVLAIGNADGLFLIIHENPAAIPNSLLTELKAYMPVATPLC